MPVSWVLLLLLILLVAWVAIDIYYPFKTDIRQINADETARIDGAMWRSYYENKKLRLFFESASLMRNQFHFPFFRSCVVSANVARAAFMFKEGKTRDDYEKAMPALRRYFASINEVSTSKFDVDSAIKTELEWWIVRRDKTIPTAEWERLLANTASVMYHRPADSFDNYAKLRVQAMVLRDKKDKVITEDDWQTINKLLVGAWRSFSVACK